MTRTWLLRTLLTPMHTWSTHVRLKSDHHGHIQEGPETGLSVVRSFVRIEIVSREWFIFHENCNCFARIVKE